MHESRFVTKKNWQARTPTPLSSKKINWLYSKQFTTSLNQPIFFLPKVVVMISLVVQFICVPCTWVSWVGEAGYNSKRVSLSGIRMLGRASVGWWCWGGISDVESDHRRWMRARGWFHSTGEISQYNDKIRQLQDILSRKVIEHARTRNRSTPHRMCASKLQKKFRYQRRDGRANRCTLLKWGISPLEKSHVWGAGRGLVTSLSAFYSLIFDDHPTQNTLTMYILYLFLQKFQIIKTSVFAFWLSYKLFSYALYALLSMDFSCIHGWLLALVGPLYPSTRLIAASVVAAATNNRHHSMDNLKYSWIASNFMQIYIIILDLLLESLCTSRVE